LQDAVVRFLGDAPQAFSPNSARALVGEVDEARTVMDKISRG